MKIKPFKLERFFSLYEFNAKYLLSSSDCEAMTIEDLLNLEKGAADQFNKQWLGYTETTGQPFLKEEISKIYDTISAEEIIVCTGAQEPIFLFSEVVLHAGDEVIIQFPCYQSVQSLPESLGCKVLHWLVKQEDGKLFFDVNDLAKLITSKTKVIYLNTPHNPTGYHFTKNQQAEIIELARKQNMIIFCDEVYRELEHKEDYKLPAIADAYEHGFSLGVMSKAYGLPGLRIGWLASKNKKILDDVAMMKEYTTLSNSVPSEFLAAVALRNRHKILERNLQIVASNISLLDNFFHSYKYLFTWCKPIAGPIGFVKINIDIDDTAFAESVINKKSVMILPGDVYDYKGYFRIGFGRKNMPEALHHFELYIKENL